MNEKVTPIMGNTAIAFAVVAAVIGVAVAAVALAKLMQLNRARAVLVTATLAEGHLVVEVVNTNTGIVTLEAVGLWVSTDKRHGRPKPTGELYDDEDFWELSSTMLELTEPRLPVELEHGVWKSWRVPIEGRAVQADTRVYVTAYLKHAGGVSAIARHP